MTQYQAAHVDGAYRVYATETGIDRTYFDQPFRKPRPAIAYSDELAGLPGRHPSPDLARDRISTASRDEVAVPIEAPDPDRDASSVCAGCGGPLPPGRHGQRRLTCSVACRRAAARHAAARAVGADTDGGTPLVTPSRPSEAASDPDPTPRVDRGSHAPRSTQGAGADSASRGVDTGPLLLGLT